MKSSWKIAAACLFVGGSTFAVDLSQEVVAKKKIEVISSEQLLGQCLEQIQRQYFPVCLPSLSERLFQPAGSFPVDWSQFDPDTRKLFRGWIDGNGIVHYAVGLYEDYWTGEIVALDDSGWEMFRILRDNSYDKYSLQRELFNLGEKEVLSDKFSREIFLPSKIATVVDLVPTVFWDAYVEIEREAEARSLADSMESSSAPVESETVSVGMALVPAGEAETLAVESEPVAMAMDSSPPPVPDDGSNTNNVSGGGGSSNLLVELAINLPEGFGYLDHIELFAKDDLIYSTSWELADSWIPTYRNQTAYWIDPASSNKMTRFYLITDGNDSDGDGYSDLREALIEGTDSNSFDTVNSDGDDLNDWLEYRLFGDLSQTGSSDFDGDQIPNNEELVFDAAGRPVALLTDPTLFSSDGDTLSDAEMFAFPPTDPWNPDTSVPAATLSWPTNNAVVVF